MLVGPVFTREVVTAPRRARLFILRAAYVLALLVLMCTAWLVLAGTQVVSAVGDVARFGSALFPFLACIQLALAVFFSALLSASAVAQEKDRRTLILLLLTNLTNSELVLGKLLASLLNVLVLLAAALPLLMLSALLGGIGFDQIARVMAVTVASALAAGSLGSTLALWREKTFQALALTTLTIVLWLAAWEIVRTGALGAAPAGVACEAWASWFSPWRAMLEAVRPVVGSQTPLGSVAGALPAFVGVAVGITVGLNLIAIIWVRVWNPSRQARAGRDANATQESIWGAQHESAKAETEATEPAAASVHAAPGRLRPGWNNPILWR
ncbi:MAG: ABC transporter permease subunit, partial [Planctomycetes bacterium]|nr:ABC transporter permease subunit [Planctomycetota bacterium]